MKRILNDKEFRKAMEKIEKEAAKIFGKTPAQVTAGWNGDNTIEIVVS
jgi:hypothetical protein